MKAVIYARVSSTTDRQNTNRQVSDLTAYAVGMSFDICYVFTEHVSGAKKNQDRPILQKCIEYCKQNSIDILLISELSRLGRNAFEVLACVKELLDCGINLFMQKEQITLLDREGKPSMIAPVMIAILSTCAELERDNIQYRLKSGYKNYRENGGKVGRKPGSIKPVKKLKEEYKDVIKELEKGESIRRTAKLHDVSISTVQRIKKIFSL